MSSEETFDIKTLTREIQRRRTFAIISHPDAGKTTITEKLLLFGKAIQMAGSVKAKRSKKFATSDWMELEKQRGISVTSSVMSFPYLGHEINLIDTPGHQDFSEDTYRTLTAVDSALMLIDAANGVETQTKKLFEVCALKQTPIMSFINKMDRPGREPFELLEEIENVLGIKTYPVTWPLGSGDRFVGIYNRFKKELILYEKGKDGAGERLALPNPQEIEQLKLPPIDAELITAFKEELELLEGAGDAFEHERYLKGELAPVFFGSALTSFGVDEFLDHFVEFAPAPLARDTAQRRVDPLESKFSAFIFKIQANMDPSHRDRVAFMRICSGRFERGMKAFHVRSKKSLRLGRPTQFMAQDRSLVDEAVAGDIVGIHDPGVFSIGDSLSEGEALQFKGIPHFAPEHFVRVQLENPLKSKQLSKGLDQLSEEGAIQVFRPLTSNDQYLGVVGALQIDVVKFRIQAEYGVEVRMFPLPFTAARWVHSEDAKAMEKFRKEQESNLTMDSQGHLALLLDHDWRVKFHAERYPMLQFLSTQEAIRGS